MIGNQYYLQFTFEGNISFAKQGIICLASAMKYADGDK